MTARAGLNGPGGRSGPGARPTLPGGKAPGRDVLLGEMVTRPGCWPIYWVTYIVSKVGMPWTLSLAMPPIFEPRIMAVPE